MHMFNKILYCCSLLYQKNKKELPISNLYLVLSKGAVSWNIHVRFFLLILYVLHLQIFELLREQLWYRPNPAVYIKLIVMLGKCKQPEKAHELFQAMIDEGCDVTCESYTALLSAYSRSGLFDRAFSILEQMKKSPPNCQPDVNTYSILIKSCLQVFEFDKVELLLSDMKSQGIKPNTVTYNTLIDAYGQAKMYVAIPSLLYRNDAVCETNKIIELCKNVFFFSFLVSSSLFLFSSPFLKE